MSNDGITLRNIGRFIGDAFRAVLDFFLDFDLGGIIAIGLFILALWVGWTIFELLLDSLVDKVIKPLYRYLKRARYRYLKRARKE